jgi:hypothetical protein
MSNNVFHDHLDVCKQCREHPFALCPVGAAALEQATQDLAAKCAPLGQRSATFSQIRIPEPVETIVAAAIQYNGIIYQAPPPARHHTVIKLMIDQGLPDESCTLRNQGFVTSSGRFVDRYEGAAIARTAGQLVRDPTPPDMLTSEDVW